MKSPQSVSAAQAVASIQSGNRVFLHGSAATPVCLIKALLDRHKELKDVEIVSITTLGELDFADPAYAGSFFF